MEMVIGPDWIARHLPHGDGMCLLDGVVQWDDARIHCLASPREPSLHPLRCTAGAVHAVHAVEYAAQAAGVHGALRAPGGGVRQGRIAGVRDVRWCRPTLDTTRPLAVWCHLTLEQARAVVYDFELSVGNEWATTGQVTIAFPEGT